MALSDWDRFVIWSYTLGSGTVNSYLLGMLDKEDLFVWFQRIMMTYNQVTKGKGYKLPPKFRPFFKGPSVDRLAFLDLYAKHLQRIIKGAPPTQGTFKVYKASSPYPSLKVGDVYQRPFNSTSYRIDTNYSIFLPPGGLCCMHEITVPKGSRVLFLSPLLSAYPDEAEVLFPYGVSFRVSRTSSMKLNVPRNTTVQWKKVQEPPFSIGPVFFYNYSMDCDTEKRYVKTYVSTLVF
jgi:hypothetical protein